MKTVKLMIEDEILAGIVTEQIVRFCKLWTAGETPDLIIGRVKTAETLPHLLLGGKNEEGCEVIPMPLRLGDMNDRLRYMLSGRNRFASSAEIEFSGYRLNAEDGVMTQIATSKELRLTDKEKQMIFSLYAAEGHFLDRNALLTAVWGYAETAETHTLETHLYRLRQKLEDSFGLKDLIVTKDGLYTLKI